MTITDADRVAAADILDEVSSLLDHVGIGQVADLIRDGEYDEHECLKLTATHREQAVQEAVAERDARIAELRKALESIQEYWNRDQNDMAMHDACWHAINIAEAALQEIDNAQG